MDRWLDSISVCLPGTAWIGFIGKNKLLKFSFVSTRKADKFWEPLPPKSIYVFFGLSFYLSVYLSTYIFIYLSIYLSIDLSNSPCLYLFIIIYLCINIYIYLSIAHFIKPTEIQCICKLDLGKVLWNWLAHFIKPYRDSVHL